MTSPNTETEADPDARLSPRSVISALALAGLTIALWQMWVKPELVPFATAPPIPAAAQSLEGLHVHGSREAKAGLIVFSDFECPVCATFANDVLPAIMDKYVSSGQIILAFGDFPLESIHPSATRRAAIAECAARQGLFWEVHDRLFAAPTVPGVERDAVGGLNQDALQVCLSSDAPEVIRSRKARAEALGIRSTPSLLIGTMSGSKLQVKEAFAGLQTVEQLSRSLERSLGR